MQKANKKPNKPQTPQPVNSISWKRLHLVDYSSDLSISIFFFGLKHRNYILWWSGTFFIQVLKMSSFLSDTMVITSVCDYQHELYGRCKNGMNILSEDLSSHFLIFELEPFVRKSHPIRQEFENGKTNVLFENRECFSLFMLFPLQVEKCDIHTTDGTLFDCG